MPAKPSKPTIAMLPAHPSQVWMLHAVAGEIADWATIRWYLRAKDVSCAIADALDLDYQVISKAGRGLFANATELAVNIGRVARETRSAGVDWWLSKYGAANIGARMAGARSISFNDDDYDLVPLIAWTSYPFARAVLATDATRMGPFASKTLRFTGFKELIYLHPARFFPDSGVVGELGINPGTAYVLIRLSALEAHHDKGVSGLSGAFLSRLINGLPSGVVPVISSEKPLSSPFEHLRMPIPPHRVHHVLAFAECLISDSQTMSAEAAVLGTPSLRLNSFVGRISSHIELDRYGLSFGFKPGEEEELEQKLNWLVGLGNTDRQDIFSTCHDRLLTEKPDPLPFVADTLRSLIAATPKRRQPRNARKRRYWNASKPSS